MAGISEHEARDNHWPRVSASEGAGDPGRAKNHLSMRHDAVGTTANTMGDAAKRTPRSVDHDQRHVADVMSVPRFRGQVRGC